MAPTPRLCVKQSLHQSARQASKSNVNSIKLSTTIPPQLKQKKRAATLTLMCSRRQSREEQKQKSLHSPNADVERNISR